jgi:predicted GNAT family N-acyltransferase
MTRTYLEVARHARGNERFELEGIIGCRSLEAHAAANFAFIARPSPESLTELCRMIKDIPTFTSYLLPTDRDDVVKEELESRGFLFSNKLHLMFYRGPKRSRMSNEFERRELEQINERYEHMLFLARQFFVNADLKFQRTIAMLTASSKSCQLFAWEDQLQTLMGGMYTEFENTLGLYNLTVTPSKRGKGFGRSMIFDCLARSSKECVTLQCYKPLVTWYETMGFRDYGTVQMFSAPISF